MLDFNLSLQSTPLAYTLVTLHFFALELHFKQWFKLTNLVSHLQNSSSPLRTLSILNYHVPLQLGLQCGQNARTHTKKERNERYFQLSWCTILTRFLCNTILLVNKYCYFFVDFFCTYNVFICAKAPSRYGCMHCVLCCVVNVASLLNDDDCGWAGWPKTFIHSFIHLTFYVNSGVYIVSN